jgi:hypothetical protein
MIESFEGNKAETKTMLPTITPFMTAHQFGDVTVVADGLRGQPQRGRERQADLHHRRTHSRRSPTRVGVVRGSRRASASAAGWPESSRPPVDRPGTGAASWVGRSAPQLRLVSGPCHRQAQV